MKEKYLALSLVILGLASSTSAFAYGSTDAAIDCGLLRALSSGTRGFARMITNAAAPPITDQNVSSIVRQNYLILTSMAEVASESSEDIKNSSLRGAVRNVSQKFQNASESNIVRAENQRLKDQVQAATVLSQLMDQLRDEACRSDVVTN